jgi:hypothetical protein
METATATQDSKPRRAYKACLHCRKRKSKCDLGDVDHPREPPCRRCAREGVQCTFVDSRRGGRSSFLKGQLEKDNEVGEALQQHGGAAFGSLSPSLPEANFSTFSDSQPDQYQQSPAASSRTSLLDGNEQSNYRKRRRQDRSATPDPLNPKSLAEASLQNPTDALEILALASAGVRSNPHGTSEDSAERSPSSAVGPERRAQVSETGRGTGVANSSRRGGAVADLRSPRWPHLQKSTYSSSNSRPQQSGQSLHQKSSLLAASIVSLHQLRTYVDQFFARHHHIFPIVPVSRIPRNEEQLALFALEENHLVTAMVVIASRHDAQNPQVHDLAWGYMQVMRNRTYTAFYVAILNIFPMWGRL